jgi:hypothetical protein
VASVHVRQLHRKIVLFGGRLDAELMKRRGQQPKLPVKVLFQRLHWKLSIVDSFKYRLALLTGKPYTVSTD